MVLGQHKIPKIGCALYRTYRCSYSSFSNSDIKKSVFISQSRDVFENLALESWLYRNMDFKNHHILMLWRNDPCVVIGRNQNPWLEVDMDHVKEKGIQLARRSSGGGAVYQDNGNLNLTFFTTRERHDNFYDLEIIKRALFREYNLKVSINSKELSLRNVKVGEAASNLGSSSAYHHCSLQIRINKDDYSQCLANKENGIETLSIKTKKSKIWNLCDENPRVSVDGLLSAIGWEYLRTPANYLKDGGKELANRQKGFHMINPTEKWFPGIANIKNELQTWDWCYGKTPTFTISRSFLLPADQADACDASNKYIQIKMVVKNGRIRDIFLVIPPGLTSTGFAGEADVVSSLKGRKFTNEILVSLMTLLGHRRIESGADKERSAIEHVRRVMTSA